MLDDSVRMSLREKLSNFSFSMLFFMTLAACFGFLMLYSAADASLDPWASRQIIRFIIGLVFLGFIALIDLRVWLHYAYIIYGLVLLLLVAVEIVGHVGMGAQRWIDLGLFNLQPSELMKVALVLALARYFNSLGDEDISSFSRLFMPIMMIMAPVILVLLQPDLGTALLILFGGAAMFFIAGVRGWVFGVAAAVALAILPLAWSFLHEYQKQRVLVFFNPDIDPLGAGYHITQSKIALGSGGLFGKGFLQGTQSHLDFLPEKQTDFIFTMLAEEWGFMGGVALLMVYLVITGYGFAIALRSRNVFGRLLAIGLTTTFFFYYAFNMAMVMGLVPVVGLPLPLVSYGGTTMIVLMMSFGLIMCVFVHRDLRIDRRVLNAED